MDPLGLLLHAATAPLARLVALPVLGAGVLLALPRRSGGDVRRIPRLVALLVATAAAACAASLTPAAATGGSDSVVEAYAWVEAWGARCLLGLDGLSFVFVALTAGLTLVAILASWESVQHRPHEFYAALLLLEAALQAVFLARDLLLFFVAWEAMLVPMFLLIAAWGGAGRARASAKFVAFTLAGSLPMLLGILGAYVWHGRATGEWTFALERLAAAPYPAALSRWCFLGLLLGFAVKIPVWPLHTWLPDAHTEAPTAGSILLAGVLLKMGLYGLLRVALPLFPGAAAEAAPTLVLLGLIAIFWGAWASAVQDDLKRLVAFSSVAHMGVAVVAIFAAAGGAPRPALDGAVMIALNHGISTGALFLAVGFLYDRAHARDLEAFGGLARTAPRLAVLLGIVVFSSAALPGTNGFVGEILALAGAFRYHPLVAAAAATTAVWSAAYLLGAYRRVAWGPARADASARGLDRDLGGRETLTLGALVALILLLGVIPAPVLALLDGPLDRIAEALAR